MKCTQNNIGISDLFPIVPRTTANSFCVPFAVLPKTSRLKAAAHTRSKNVLEGKITDSIVS